MAPRNPNRRDFLRHTALLGGGLLSLGGLSPLMRFAKAAQTEDLALKDRYYIFCYFGGAWDILLSLDPRDPNLFSAEQVSTTKILPAYEALNPLVENPLVETPIGTLGHFTGDLATQHNDKIAVVRGINMETLSHFAGRARFLTGKQPSGVQARGSSAATWFASMLGEENTIPHLALKVPSYNVDQPPSASAIRVNSVADLLSALKPGEAGMGDLIDQQIAALFEQEALCARSRESNFRVAAETARLKAHEMTLGGLDAHFDFLANTDAMAELRDRYDFSSNQTGLNSAGARAAMAVKALTSGISRCVSVTLVSGLDTHGPNWADVQGPRQMSGFNAIARMIEELSSMEYGQTGSSWLDHTNIVAFSEFSRGPMINKNSGRDHWLNNACLLAGADIQGGQILGASSDVGMQPQPINFETGQVDATAGEMLHPEHIIQTLMHSAGITDDRADLRVSPVPALMKSS